MLFREIFKVLALFLIFFSGILLIPAFVAFYYENYTYHPQPHSAESFLITALISLFLGGILYSLGSKGPAVLYRRESLAAVVLTWLIIPVICALPFLLSGTFDKFYQAYFEALSGITTTGLSVIEPKKFDPETGNEIPVAKSFKSGALSSTYYYRGTINPVQDLKNPAILYEGYDAIGKGIHFWRTFIQWLGGIGIIVMFLSLLPALGVGGKVLVQSEITGPVKDTLTPRLKQTLTTLLIIYFSLSVLQFFLLISTNPAISLFEALTVTFSTVSTGGYSIYSSSIGYFNNLNTEIVVMAFMFFGSINFSLYYYMIKGKFYRINQPEFILYCILITVLGVYVSWNLIGAKKILLSSQPEGELNISQAFRYGLFQYISFQTDTGFSTLDYENWPYVVQVIMLLSMFIGGMSGSTSGGIKIIREYILFKIAQNKIELLVRPETVRYFAVGSKEIDASTAINVLVFFLCIVAVSVFGVLVFVIDGIGPETALSLVACTVSNAGASFRGVGPGGSAAFLSPFASYFACLLMILGRLEFYAVLILLVPAFWKEKS